MNWGKLLSTALEVGVALKGVSDIDTWLNEKIKEISYDDTYVQALIEMAYEVAQMDAQGWDYLYTHLKIKAINNDKTNFILSYCNYVVNLENGTIKSLLSYSINDAWQMLSFNIQNMETYEIAAHYGILKAYAQRDVKAQTLIQAWNRSLR